LNMMGDSWVRSKDGGMSLAANPFGSQQYLRNKPQKYRGFCLRLTAPKVV
jgi:hypothetical protein